LLGTGKKTSSSKKPKKAAKELMVDKLFIESDDGIQRQPMTQPRI
jgi:hypothetical protein